MKKGQRQTPEYIAKTFIAGGLAGACAKTVIAPLDRVKILFQTSHPSFLEYNRTWFGPLKAVKQIYIDRGIKGLFQGHSATLLRIFPYAAVKFMSYEQIKHALMPTAEKESHALQFLAGSLAGCSGVVMTYPMDLLRVRVAFDKQTNVKHTISTIYHEPNRTFPNVSRAVAPVAGVLNFYRGFMPTIYGMIPYAGISFLTYESLKTAASKREWCTVDGKLRPWAFLCCGAISGILSQTCSYPFEVIRRQMQVSGRDTNSKHTSTLKTIRDILAKRGFNGFWVGMSIGYVKITPMFAVSFFSYEYLKAIMNIA